MDQRHAPRKTLSQDVLVYHHGLPMAHATMRDISPDSVYLETDRSYPRTAELEVELNLPRHVPRYQQQTVRLGGQVGRCDDHGFVLHLARINRVDLRLLLEFLMPSSRRIDSGDNGDSRI